MEVITLLQLSPLHFALVASVLQLLGYIVYMLKTDITPEPLSWFMWGSTTWIIAIIEADTMIQVHQEWQFVPFGQRSLLVLPILCGCMSAIIAFRCWKRGKISWPREFQNKLALTLSFSIVCIYILGWLFLRMEVIEHGTREYFAIILLVLLSLVTITEFSPIVRNTVKNPGDEKSIPWIIWTVAYLLLLIATGWETGFSYLLVYPMINILLHSSMGWLSRSTRCMKT